MLCLALCKLMYLLRCAEPVLSLDKLVSPACLCTLDMLLQSMTILQCRVLELIELPGAALVNGHYA